MSARALFNPSACIDRLMRGGFSPEQARASAEALRTALSEGVATKADMAEIKNELASLRRDFNEHTGRFRLEIDFAGVSAEIARAKKEIVGWIIIHNLILAGATLAIARYVY